MYEYTVLICNRLRGWKTVSRRSQGKSDHTRIRISGGVCCWNSFQKILGGLRVRQAGQVHVPPDRVRCTNPCMTPSSVSNLQIILSSNLVSPRSYLRKTA